MHTHESHRPLKHSVRPSPRRMFLKDMIQDFQKDICRQDTSSNSSSYSVIGIVTTKPTNGLDYQSFVLDDGTAAILVLCPLRSHSKMFVPDGMPPLKSLQLGDEIECLGGIIFNRSDHETHGEESLSFVATTYSIIENGNYTTWRTFEISKGIYRKDHTAETEIEPCINIHHDLIQKLQLDGGTVTIDRSQVFLFIQQSKDEGGISEQDIAIIMGLQSKDERDALYTTLEEMQSNFEIYHTKTFCYLPL